MFLDELIGRLLKCSVAGVDYERWVFELKVNKGRRSIKASCLRRGGEWGWYNNRAIQKPYLPVKIRFSAEDLLTENLSSGSGPGGFSISCRWKEKSRPVVEIQTGFIRRAPVLKFRDTDEADIEPVDGGSLFVTNNLEHVTLVEAPVSGHAVTALTCQDLLAGGITSGWYWTSSDANLPYFVWIREWAGFIFRLYGGFRVHSPGFITLSAIRCWGVWWRFLRTRWVPWWYSGCPQSPYWRGYQPGMSPVLNDTQFMTWMKLMYLLRCLYANKEMLIRCEWWRGMGIKAPPYRRRRWRVICPPNRGQRPVMSRKWYSAWWISRRLFRIREPEI